MFDFASFFKDSVTFKERLSQKEISLFRGNAEEAFRLGDYHHAAVYAKKNSELSAKSYILIGNPWRGLEIINNFRHVSPELTLYQAFAYWYLEDTNMALSLLTNIQGSSVYGENARELIRLLKLPKIPILMSCFREKLIDSFKNSSAFDVRFTGFSEQNTDFELDEEHKLKTEEAQDFIKCSEYYFHFDLGIPIPMDLNDYPDKRRIAFVYDVDMHLFNDGDCLRSFHNVVNCCSQSSIEVECLYGTATWSLPLFGGLSATHPGIKKPTYDTVRQNEVLFTGSIATPIYVEKPSRFFALSQADNLYKIRVMDKTFSQSKYEELLHSTAASPVSMRLQQGLGTRSLHSLQAGQCTLQFGENVISLYLDKLDLCLPISETSINQTLSHLTDTFENLADETIMHIQEQVAHICPDSPTTEDRWLKTITFLNIVNDLPDVSAIEPGNRIVNWFTHQTYDNLQSVETKLLPQRHDVNHLARSAIYAAFLERQQLVDDSKKTLQAAEAQSEPSKSLPLKLLLALQSWHENDHIEFIKQLEDIWDMKEVFQDTKEDGLVYFDLQSNLFMRAHMAPESLLNDTEINKSLLHLKENTGQKSLSTTDVLLSGIGAYLSEISYMENNFKKALSLAQEALSYCQNNPNACYRYGLLLLDAWIIKPSDSLLITGRQYWEYGICHYPWHMCHILERLAEYPDLDQQLFDGESYVVYLKFMQRIRTDRKHVSDYSLPKEAIPYLRYKLGLRHNETSIDLIKSALHSHNLILSEAEFLHPHILTPLCENSANRNGSSLPFVPAKSLIDDLLADTKFTMLVFQEGE